MPSLLDPLGRIPLTFVDVETTGAPADLGHRVIEIGIVRIENGQVAATYEQLVDPVRPISAGVVALTGITPAMVANQPRFADILPRILPLFEGAIVLGHNVAFDLSFLRREFVRAGTDLHQALGSAQVMDTVRIARRRFGRGGNALQVLSRRMGITPTAAHRALADAQTTALLFERLMEPVGGYACALCDALQQQGGPITIAPTGPRQSVLPLELEEALDNRCPVLMEYLDARDRRTQRVIHPLHVRRFRGELILVAHCQLRDAQRTFKLERIVTLTRIEQQLLLPLAESPPSENEDSARASSAGAAPLPDQGS